MHLWSSATFENLAGVWGSLVRVEDTTTEPQSFERARFLSETNRLEQIKEMVEVLTSNVLVIQVQVQEVDVVHSHDIIFPCDRENEDGESEDTTSIEHEGQAMGVNPLFWNVEANRGMTDEDVGLVYREEHLGWRL
ncbi:hypothetical protein V6N13_028912 [Hibiscus sabdariffa]